MHIINKFFLKIVLLPTGLYRKSGIDTDQLGCILTTKLIMDDRRPNSFQQTRKNSDKPTSAATLGTMAMSALLGVFMMGGFFVGTDYVTHLTVFYCFYIFLLASTLVSDFTSVLIDVRDNYILLPRPVNDRTFVVSRLLHITIHICKLLVPMNLPAFIYMVVTTNVWSAVVFLFLALLVTLFTIFLINALYLLIIKFTTPKKFQSIISYIQVFFAIFIFAGYQLGPRLADRMNVNSLNFSDAAWVWVVPSYWFAAAWKCLATGEINVHLLIATLISLTIPFVSIWAVIRYFAPAFNSKLAMISGSAEVTEQAPVTVKKRSSISEIPTWLSNRFTAGGAERMAFLFAWKMMGRSRDFKLKVYPTFGYLAVYFVMIFVNNKSFRLSDLSDETGRGRLIIISVLYASSFMMMMAIQQMIFSEKFKAAWIFFSTPVNKPGEIISGAVKAAVLKFYMPLIVVFFIAGLTLVGPNVLPNLVLGLVNELLICAVIATLTIDRLPFSVQQNNNSKSGNFFKGILSLIFPGIAGFIHYFIYPKFWLVAIFFLVSVVITWFVMRGIKTRTWAQVLRKYNEF